MKLTPLARGLSGPVLVKAAPGSPDRLYIVERTGTVRIRDNGQLLSAPFIDVTSLTVSGGEQGLLGLAFHPGYAQNGRFFLHYTEVGSEDSVVQEFQRSAADPLVADPVPVDTTLRHFTAQPGHNGGSIEFGPDGYLYIAIGDGGSQNDPECDAQNPTNLLGKVSRVDVDAPPDADGAPAAPGNPGGTRQYHIGLRNPWRMSFDVCTGDLYIGDVGQNAYEEIDLVPASSPAPANFGWPLREGKHPHTNTCPPDPGPWTEPVVEFNHAIGCSVTGGYVYRGTQIPWLRGQYVYGDYCSGRIWRVTRTGNTVSSPAVAVGISQMISNLTSFGQDGRGEMYVMSLNGTLFRIDPG